MSLIRHFKQCPEVESNDLLLIFSQALGPPKLSRQREASARFRTVLPSEDSESKDMVRSV